MRCSMEEVDRIASLSMLSLGEEKKRMLQQSLDEILEHADKLNKMDTDGVEPTTYMLEQQNVFRKDEQGDGWSREDMLANAPEQDEGCFIVPKVVD